ncbi:hypothetical protein EV363DRAFT_1208984 [Boletus edulis]|uniref:PCI domain-containing protein n=1 Tax=Boletus edulis BED1 TaxID=1328754 RepID=A0AAD4GAG5_BOLED|nr:hypothetical protein EV363DRAFT_1208984 [Boletus edulis]KAF8433032.1 hypothetical protein L210DRAFT_919635 [Boletus edulis BED1]
MAVPFTTFLVELSESVHTDDGPRLAYLLRPTSPHGKDLVKEFKNPSRDVLMSQYGGCIESPWDEIAIRYVMVTSHVARKRPGEAFNEQSQLISLFFRFFTQNTGWTLPALFSTLRDLRDLAFDADFHAKVNGQSSECMESAAGVVAKAFSNCMTDRTSPPDQSRKWGIYYVVGLIMKCYFRVKRISLSKNILRALDANPDIPPLAAYPRSHQVTYRYYLGMLSFLNEDYAKAEQELTLAFYHCHIQAHRNQERILTCLIPLRILRGHLPSRILLDRFSVLDELFSPFIAAIRTGDITAFDAALDHWERRLVELNLWITIEKARELCIRGLFRRVWVACDKSTRIPVSMFHNSLRISGNDVSVDEAECFVANMIHKGYMRGYISHEKQMIVLASTSAFPRLGDRQSPYVSL